jgi:hypothetical protein
MVDNKKLQKIREYVKKYRAKGYSNAQMTASLKKSGVSDAMIATVLKTSSSSKKALIGIGALLLLLGAGGLIFLLTSSSPDLECEIDRDCGRGFECSNNICVEEYTFVAECSADIDCSTNEECNNGNCVYITPAGSPDPECIIDNDCSFGEECTSGSCVIEDRKVGGDCGDGLCFIGEEACISDCGCSNSDQCEESFSCIDGACKYPEEVPPPEEPPVGGGQGEVVDTRCNDNIDNDGDGLIDYPFDLGCTSLLDDDERNACSDGIDNDGDGFIDLLDLHCLSRGQNTELEVPARCADGWDNDGDGLIDLADPDCLSLGDESERGSASFIVASPPLECDSFACLAQASETCELAQYTSIITTDLLGVTQSTTTYNEIIGSDLDKCLLYLRTENIDLVFPAGTDAVTIAEQNDLYDALEGQEGTCKFETVDLTNTLLRWEDGIFSNLDWDVAECSGTMFDAVVYSAPSLKKQNALEKLFSSIF